MTQSISQEAIQASQAKRDESGKRKYDDMSLDFNVNNGGPAPLESYERSRPQTPSVTPGRELPPNPASMAAPPISSPNQRQNADTFMGGTNSRPQTRPATPFNPSFSVPATPPDLYLVTRNSPNLSQSIWENFQPDQLFPEGSSMMQQMPFSPASQTLDPSLMPGMVPMQGGQAPQANSRMRGAAMSESPVQGGLLQPGTAGYQVQQSMWQGGFDQPMPDGQGHSPSDTWSNSSAPAVPTTVNVEDWFVPRAFCRGYVLC
jgi:hypothetical protein